MNFFYSTLIFTLILSSASLSAALHWLHPHDEIKSEGSDVKILLPTQSNPTPDPTKPLSIPDKTLLLPTTQILYPSNQRPLNIRTRFSFPCRHHRLPRFRAGSAREIGDTRDVAEVIGHRHVAAREEKVKLNGFMIPMKMIRHHHDGDFEVKGGVSESAWKLIMHHRRHHHQDDDEHHHDDDEEHHEHHHDDDDEHHEHHHHHNDEHHEHHHHEGIINKIRKFLTHF